MTAAQPSTREDPGGSEVVILQQRVPFTMIDNPIIRESTDYVALGMYVDLMSYPAGKKINLRDIAKTKKQGRTVLTDAMNSLIARRLVFRVRYQEQNGQWKTKTYVCARPVTLDELQAVRSEYLGKCSFETTPELSTALNPSQTTSDQTDVPDATDTNEAAKPLVTPSARFPALGEPAPGQPAVGTPVSGNQVPQRKEVKDLDPPPTPSSGPPVSPTHPNREEEEDRQQVEQTPEAGGDPPGDYPLPVPVEHADTAKVVAALAAAWPVGQRDLAKMRPAVSAALGVLSTGTLIEHLSSNTAGAIHPPSVLRARLDNLPQAKSPPRRLGWCGSCSSSSYRWVTDEDGQPLRPCPTCSPQAARAADKVGATR